MATNDLMLWGMSIFVEWFFLARREKEDGERNIGLENLGWFVILMTAVVGMGVIKNGESAMAFVFGVMVFLIAFLRLITNLATD